ncbi:hypothetical protein SAMN04488109_4681 [Chryseolinea serpens]|uniref:Uncharacterized protein n=1 Tax=Chryseolinea serpens TaxID=947013 RepID=A0A1M5UGI8_9BACT|nr:hypothetical protein [Chryseolinea serpens]SHH62162.1 hypothetical protein SAMN04488109_4681 [Chryseolinea serpens]
MKIFGVNFGSSSNHFKIIEDDRTWLEENFRWLKSAFGYPNKRQEQVLLTPKFFPATYSVTTVSVDNIVTDLCKLFGLARNAVAFEIVTDIRDFGIPYQMEGPPFECETDLTKGHYKISIANDLQKRPQRLLHRLIYEFIRIRLTESKIEFDGDDDAGPFIYLAGIYFGFGVILSQNLSDVGRSSQGGWQSKWGYVSEIAEPVMAYGLAMPTFWAITILPGKMS